MSQLQNRTAVSSLTQSLYNLLQQLNLAEEQLDVCQAHLDEVLSITNNATKDAKPEKVETVDKERKERRKKEKSDKKDKENEKV